MAAPPDIPSDELFLKQFYSTFQQKNILFLYFFRGLCRISVFPYNSMLSCMKKISKPFDMQYKVHRKTMEVERVHLFDR